MAINRSQLAKELEPGLHALFGMEYGTYQREYEQIFEMDSSEKAFEEEVALSAFGAAPEKGEGAAVSYDTAQEFFTARYVHKTYALAYSITEEAMDDNLYDSLSKRYTKALARSHAHTRNQTGANVLNNGHSGSYTGGDGVALFSAAHPLVSGANQSNTVSADLSETSLENAVIAIADWKDNRGLPINIQAKKLVIPTQNMFTAERIINSELRVGTADNDTNAMRNMGMFSEGVHVNHFLTDPDSWYLMTDAPRGMIHFERKPMTTQMEPEFETGNYRFKASCRYSFGWSDWRGAFGSAGA